MCNVIKGIHKVNEKLKGITILAGTEVDIWADGSLDFDNKLLAEFDFVIAAIHSGLGNQREKATNRTLKATGFLKPMEYEKTVSVRTPTAGEGAKRERSHLNLIRRYP